MPDTTHSVLSMIALWGGLGVVLVWLALQMNLLQERVRPGRCAACGRRLERGRECPCVGRE